MSTRRAADCAGRPLPRLQVCRPPPRIGSHGQPHAKVKAHAFVAWRAGPGSVGARSVCEKCGQRLPVVSSKYTKKRSTRRSQPVHNTRTTHTSQRVFSLAEKTARNAIVARKRAPGRARAARRPGRRGGGGAGAVAVPARCPRATVAGGRWRGGRWPRSMHRAERGVYAAVRASSSTVGWAGTPGTASVVRGVWVGCRDHVRGA